MLTPHLFLSFLIPRRKLVQFNFGRRYITLQRYLCEQCKHRNSHLTTTLAIKQDRPACDGWHTTQWFLINQALVVSRQPQLIIHNSQLINSSENGRLLPVATDIVQKKEAGRWTRRRPIADMPVTPDRYQDYLYLLLRPAHKFVERVEEQSSPICCGLSA